MNHLRTMSAQFTNENEQLSMIKDDKRTKSKFKDKTNQIHSRIGFAAAIWYHIINQDFSLRTCPY